MTHLCRAAPPLVYSVGENQGGNTLYSPAKVYGGDGGFILPSKMNLICSSLDKKASRNRTCLHRPSISIYEEENLSDKTRVCFICLGNIVRSPLAHNLFAHLVKKEGLEHKYEVDSAGTSGWHAGESPDARMRRVAARYGLKYDGRAKQFQPADFDRYDLIIAMDQENRERLLSMARTPEEKSKVRLLREFDPQGSPQAPVPDPYYGGIDGFEEVFAIVDRSVRSLLDALEEGRLENPKK
jgi:protein-tyrosine phosphatase